MKKQKKSIKESLKVKVVNQSKNNLPEYQTLNSAGLDLMANLEMNITLKPLERAIIPTGLFIELPIGYEAQIRPRSGLAIKHGITVLNSPGTIDSDYRGEIKVILVNVSKNDFIINNGERICQMIITKHERIEWIESDKINNTERGIGGFGHTGK